MRRVGQYNVSHLMSGLLNGADTLGYLGVMESISLIVLGGMIGAAFALAGVLLFRAL